MLKHRPKKSPAKCEELELKAHFADEITHDSGSPEVFRIVWGGRTCSTLEAIEYFDGDAVHQPEELKWLAFHNVMAYFNASTDNTLVKTKPGCSAVILEIVGSPLLSSFFPSHTIGKKHFQICFLNEFWEVICREIHLGRGSFGA